MFDKILAHTSFIGETGYANHSRNFFTALNKFLPVKIRNFSVGKTWNGLSLDPHGQEFYITNEHRSMLYKQTCRDHDKLVDFDIYNKIVENKNDINIILNEVNHHYFYDQYPGKKIAYNVWESTLYPDSFFNKLLEFDQLWVPTQWQKNCVVQQGYPEERVKIVPEAVDSSLFFPEELKQNEILEEYKDGRFKFLLLGRWDYRKSTKEIIETFLKTFNKNEPVDLIVSIDNCFATDGLENTHFRLLNNGFNDNRIKIKSFINRSDYIKYLKMGHVLVSCARSEGWSLPLIESMACGTPSIYSNWGAQLEFAEGKGLPVNILGEKLASCGTDNSYKMISDDIPGYYCEPDFNHLSSVMREVYENYSFYKEKALEESIEIREQFTWEKSAKIAYTILEKLDKKESFSPAEKININFISGAFCEITGVDRKNNYKIEFIDKKDNKIIYSDSFSINHWAKCSREYFINWQIKITDNFQIRTYNFNLENKNCLIVLDSKSLGDTIAWFPYVEEFRKKHKCHIMCSTFWNNLFKDQYKEIEFINPGAKVDNLYAQYIVGWFNPVNFNKNPIDYRTISLQKTASDILGLEYQEIRPKIKNVIGDREIKEKYVCIGIHSTCQAKYWNYPNGWQEIVDYLNLIGYRVVLISKEKSPYMGNFAPSEIIDKSGDYSIEDRMVDLKYADFYIGVGSGLSWLAWVLEVPVILISGFSNPLCEFTSGVERIFNNTVCNGCFNDTSFIFDKGDWAWCPRNKNFECTKKIVPEIIINSIEKIIKK